MPVDDASAAAAAAKALAWLPGKRKSVIDIDMTVVLVSSYRNW
jgi:hypothetical protein